MPVFQSAGNHGLGFTILGMESFDQEKKLCATDGDVFVSTLLRNEAGKLFKIVVSR
jgi:hypothetical protein